VKTKKNPKADCCLVLQLSLLPGDGGEEQGAGVGMAGERGSVQLSRALRVWGHCCQRCKRVFKVAAWGVGSRSDRVVMLGGFDIGGILVAALSKREDSF